MLVLVFEEPFRQAIDVSMGVFVEVVIGKLSFCCLASCELVSKSHGLRCDNFDIRPLSILVRTNPQSSEGNVSSSHDPDTQELLLRKERALQRRRSLRRIAWDLGVWFLLVPVGGGGIVWAVGRLAYVW